MEGVGSAAGGLSEAGAVGRDFSWLGADFGTAQKSGLKVSIFEAAGSTEKAETGDERKLPSGLVGGTETAVEATAVGTTTVEGPVTGPRGARRGLAGVRVSELGEASGGSCFETAVGDGVPGDSFVTGREVSVPSAPPF